MYLVLYIVGFLITAIVAEYDNLHHEPDDRIPALGVFFLCSLWPLVWLANIIDFLDDYFWRRS